MATSFLIELNLSNLYQKFFIVQLYPFIRIGIIVKGTGTCITPEGNTPLFPGLFFIIEEETLHSFKTEEELLIVAYHPDSDYQYPFLSQY